MSCPERQGCIVFLHFVLPQATSNMQKMITTERLIFRPFTPQDDFNLLNLDSNAAVHTYLGNNPISTIEQAQSIISNLCEQYASNGIGRWATFELHTGRFIGWSGLKYVTELENNHSHYYDVGYRFMPQFWGKGYATEACKAALAYGFEQIGVDEIIGAAHVDNKASRRVLEKCGLQFVEQFMWKDILCDWLKITSADWQKTTSED